MRQIILDTETTGLDPAQGHRIVELACVEMENRSLTGRHLHLYFNPDRDSDPEALAVHGLTTDFLSGHPRFEEVAQQLVDYVKDARSEEHTSELQSLMRISYAVFCLKNKKDVIEQQIHNKTITTSTMQPTQQ